MYNELVLSGGGIKGIAIIGSLSYLEDIHILKNIKNYIGTSVGGFISFLLVVGFNCKELMDISLNLDFNEYSDITLTNLIETYGFDNFKKMGKIIIAIIKQKGINKDITFEQLYQKTKKGLTITGSNISKGRLELFNKEKTPNMKVLIALQITMSIPIFFRPVLFNGFYYVDGGIYDPYPIKYANNIKKTLGIFLKKEENNETNVVIDSLGSYMKHVLICFYNEFKEKILKSGKYKDSTIIVDAESVSSIKFNLDKDDKNEIMNIGKDKSIKYIDNKFNKIRLAYLLKKNYIDKKRNNGKKVCMAIKKNGKRCQYLSKFTENNKNYCGIHKNLL